ncbi:hypothetical protein MNBD_UNCLBAC01-557 [hydrothermal vent metagenome]|uniref:PilZ domain-containing protein n=1 Tax=hydrothermal vent metagenome TaxID=652676 RepID=A0A3B1DR33_9ZZZZ
MSNWESLNRRKFPRVNYPCLVIIRKEEDDEQNVILTHTENVGVGGVCVILKKDVKRFTKVDLELDLLDLENHIKCQGKVVWNVQRKGHEEKKPAFYDIGIEFDFINDDDQVRLQEIVNRMVKNKQEIN